MSLLSRIVGVERRIAPRSDSEFPGWTPAQAAAFRLHVVHTEWLASKMRHDLGEAGDPGPEPSGLEEWLASESKRLGGGDVLSQLRQLAGEETPSVSARASE